MLANHAEGEEEAAADAMHRFWTTASKTNLYEQWSGGSTMGLIFKGGLLDSDPLANFLKAWFPLDKEIKRKLDIGIVDITDGSYRDFSEKNITSSARSNSMTEALTSLWSGWSSSKKGDNALADALYASMSFAGFAPPADVLGSTYIDGSAAWDVDVFTAINRCTE